MWHPLPQKENPVKSEHGQGAAAEPGAAADTPYCRSFDCCGWNLCCVWGGLAVQWEWIMQRPLLVLLHQNDSHVLQAARSESVLRSLCSTTAVKQEKYCKGEKTFGQMLFLCLVIWLLHAWNCALFLQLLELTCSTFSWVPWTATSSPELQHLHWFQQDPARLCCACQPSLLPIHGLGLAQGWAWPHTGLAVPCTGSSQRLPLCAGQGLTPPLSNLESNSSVLAGLDGIKQHKPLTHRAYTK